MSIVQPCKFTSDATLVVALKPLDNDYFTLVSKFLPPVQSNPYVLVACM